VSGAIKEIILDQIPQDAQASHDKIDTQIMLKQIGVLPRRHRNVLKLYYLKGQSLRQIAPQYHVSYQRVQQMINQSLRTIRKSLSGDETV
jgi:RNA polymerase sigma factor (sigma-70 family)